MRSGLHLWRGLQTTRAPALGGGDGGERVSTGAGQSCHSAGGKLASGGAWAKGGAEGAGNSESDTSQFRGRKHGQILKPPTWVPPMFASHKEPIVGTNENPCCASQIRTRFRDHPQRKIAYFRVQSVFFLQDAMSQERRQRPWK